MEGNGKPVLYTYIQGVWRRLPGPSRPAQEDCMNKIEAFLREHRITEVECMVSDLTGIARGKIAPTAKFMSEKGMRLPESILLQSVTGDYVEDGVYYDLLDP